MTDHIHHSVSETFLTEKHGSPCDKERPAYRRSVDIV